MKHEVLSIYTVYYDTKDYPGVYCVRRCEYLEPKEILGTTETLEQAREIIPQFLYRMDRSPEDDRCVVESWI